MLLEKQIKGGCKVGHFIGLAIEGHKGPPKIIILLSCHYGTVYSVVRRSSFPSCC